MESTLKCPVTALHLYKDFILSGQGSMLIIYSKRTHEKIYSIKLLSKSRIYKFCQNQHLENFFVALAGKSSICFSIVENDNGLIVTLQSLEKSYNAWMWDGFWVTQNQILLISAHNTVILWNYESNTTKLVSSCSEQCILYSATFSEIEYEIYVGVGTVFNNVLVWKVKHNLDEHYYEDTYKTFSGHEGVIFRVRFHENKKQLLSVSDDRSIRLWNIKDQNCLRIMYGHSARVWDAQYLLDNIVSIGEDAVCLLWNKEGLIEKKLNTHKGKSIWSLSVSAGLVITGGGDGSIRMLCLQHEPLLKKNLIKLPNLNCSEDNDFPRHVKILDETCCLILTNQGKFYKYVQPLHDWILIDTDERYCSYSCVALLDQMVAAGNLYGVIKVFFLDNCYPPIEISAFDGKVYNLLWLKVAKETFLLVCGPEGETVLYSLSLSSLKLHYKFVIPYSRQRWVTTALIMEHLQNMYLICGDRRGSIHLYNTNYHDSVQVLLNVHGKTGVTFIATNNNRILTTGRDGTYREYELESNKLTLVDKQKSCKGLEWVEGIWKFGNDIILYGFYMQSYFAGWSPRLNEVLFKIKCGGGYRSWDVSFSEQGSDKASKLVFTYLKGITINIVSYDLKINYQALILEDPLHGKEVTSIKVLGKRLCGETYEWLMAAASEDTTVTLICYNPAKKTIVLLHTCTGHIGGVKDICFVLDKQCLSKIDGFLFSCGSRTSLKCWRLFYDIFVPMKSLPMELSPFYNEAGQTYQDLNVFKKTMSCSLFTEIYNPELKKKKKNLDQETQDDVRFLSCSSFKLNEIAGKEYSVLEHILCICACSDGVTRVYLQTKYNFKLFLILEFHKHCVQAARYIITEKALVFIITVATDGYLAVWNITEALSDFVSKMHVHDYTSENKEHYENKRIKFHDLCFPCFKNTSPVIYTSLHQSGINAIDIYSCKIGYLIATGGDDNALCISLFNLNSLQILAKDQNAHFSQITGVKFINEHFIVSTSVDQRVYVWNLDNFSLKRVCERHVNIADISCLEIWIENGIVYLAIGGMGVEILSFNILELVNCIK
ncbi:tRNA (34-2'-O)-methyltransferase regulator WDR6 isoform X1 [Hydra vulgaris]|uniref:tRNA (34-2'-O)-methyltransferase regulator WDR6 isoform X1 n=1 Tax=Hydra vulgaris TaxID=6087 RepID=UPI001F5E6EC2|nr:WD repeat-containing protein 6-like isoform X1 [Hydra vulgaris]XP_047128726.1 WD repeat-containing protein 6-like isoform X1 [Hydra vulgaris]